MKGSECERLLLVQTLNLHLLEIVIDYFTASLACPAHRLSEKPHYFYILISCTSPSAPVILLFIYHSVPEGAN